jgi:3'-phosphoadenosine 5'-phosphosulfate sulfotransferase (PAPS reductase)/FAD synthetase
MTQLELIERERVDPTELLERVVHEHKPVRSYCLVSGGNDSTAALLAAKDHVDAAVFLDTGTSLPGVEEHARRVAEKVGVEFLVYRTKADEYERMVLDHGFPGPHQHRIAYVRLKERPLDALVRDSKVKRMDRVLIVTGVRRHESVRRMGTTVDVSRKGAKVWAAPIIDMTKSDVHRARTAAGIEQSEVAALIHRSGECNCGAYAKPDERDELKLWFPEWFERIERLEGLARERGHGPLAEWGHTLRAGRNEGAPGIMCEGCEQTTLPV